MRMSDPARRALALRLFGSGKKGEPPGPLDAGWVVAHLAGTRTTLMRWRQNGIPPDRVEDVLIAIRAVLPETETEAAPSVTRRLLAGVIALEKKAGVSPAELESAQDSATAIEAAMEADARLAAELEGSRHTRAGRAGRPGGAPAGGSQGSKRQKP